MAETDRFLRRAALGLIHEEGVRLIKAPSENGYSEAWTPGWDEWDELLVGDGPGTRPSVYALRAGSGSDEVVIRDLYESLASRLSGNAVGRLGTGLTIRAVAIICLESSDEHLAKRLSRAAPRRFYQHVKPELWIVDLSAGKLYAPKSFGLFESQSARAVQAALEDTLTSGGDVGDGELARAQLTARSGREQFISTIRSNTPYVTYLLLAVCWIVFVAESVYAGGSLATSAFSSIPSNATSLQFGAMEPVLFERGQWWRLFTEMFVHFGFLHIFMNSIALYSVGSLVERLYGSVRYIVIYFVSGLFASVVSTYYLIWSGQSTELAGGASGAIFGIAGVVMVLALRKQSIVPRALAIQLSTSMGVLIVLNLAFNAVVPGIDIRAHVGGLAAGLILGYFLMPRAVEKVTA